MSGCVNAPGTVVSMRMILPVTRVPRVNFFSGSATKPSPNSDIFTCPVNSLFNATKHPFFDMFVT